MTKIASLLCSIASYLLAAEGQNSNTKLQYFHVEPVQPGGQQAVLDTTKLWGRLLDNVANRNRQGSGFNPLFHLDYPDKPIFRTQATGLNFEHIFNGVAKDSAISMFTPRRDLVKLTAHSRQSATLHWPADGNSWGAESSMKYTFAAPDIVDLQFQTKFSQDRFGQGYAAFMWASYMGFTRDRFIHFYGIREGVEGWTRFGETQSDGNIELGTIRHAAAQPLPFEKGAQTLNIVENDAKQFLKPFYFGLLDGDHDMATREDTLAYIVMFDQMESIRFAVWNFIRNSSGAPDPHRPAWDWQFVVRKPELGKEYGYRTRIIIQRFTTAEDVLKLYERWVASLN